jgi:hypothetical protein
MTRKRDKVAVLGFTEHRAEAPWGHPDWDFKGLNDAHGMIATAWPKDKGDPFKSDQVVWYQLHRRQSDGEFPGSRDPEHRKWLSSQTCPIWMWQHEDEIPASLPYPLHEVLTKAMLPTGEPLSPEAYYNNSISWMIAHAILEGYTTIGLYGVDMAQNGVHGESEYGYQRPSVEYFIGVARGLGIRVVMPQQSELCKCAYLYGYENKTHFRKKALIRLEALELQEAELVDTYEATKRAIYQIRGALQIVSGDGIAPPLQKLMEAVPVELRQQAVAGLTQEETQATMENEAAKRALHETRGAKNDVKWTLTNYFPGEGPIQDVYRGEQSLVVPALAVAALAPSDGQPPKAKEIKNRLEHLMTPLSGIRDVPAPEQ